MISVFDTHPVVFEGSNRTLTISYNGVLCKEQSVKKFVEKFLQRIKMQDTHKNYSKRS